MDADQSWLETGVDDDANYHEVTQKNALTHAAEFDKAEQHDLKAAYWESMTGKVDLSMPESVEYFEHELKKAEAHHKELKDDPAKRAHSMSLSYASKNVKDLKNKVETAKKLWL